MKSQLNLVLVLLFAIVANSANAQKKYLSRSIFLNNQNHTQAQTSKPFYKSGGSSQWLRVAEFETSPDDADTFAIYKYSYYPNGNLRQTKQSERATVGDSFVDNNLTSYTFDAAGNQTVILVQDYDNFHNLINYSKDTFSYDAHNNTTFELSELWSSGVWVLSYGFKTLYIYDANGNIKQEIAQTLDTTGAFINNLRADFFWNASGTNLDSALEYMPDSLNANKWDVSVRVINISLLNGNLYKILSATLQTDTGGTWKNYLRITNTYNTLGSQLTELYERYSKSAWVPYYRSLSKYNLHNDLYIYKYYSYVDSLKSFQISQGQADSLQYDVHGNLITDQQYFYYSWSTAWTEGNKLAYQYKEFTSIKNDESISYTILVYPNPCNDHFTIMNKNPDADLKISLYDITGKLVLEMQNKGSGPITVPTAFLPKGIYNLVLVNGNQVSSSRIVKE